MMLITLMIITRHCWCHSKGPCCCWFNWGQEFSRW